MIDAKHFTEKEIEDRRNESLELLRQWEEHVRGLPYSRPFGARSDFIVLPGGGIVGHSTRPEDICVTCTVGKHGECSKFTTHGDMCQCPCNEAY